MVQNKRTVLRWLVVLVILQSVLSIYAIARIPVDPKNMTGLGLTRGRLILIALIVALDGAGLIGLVFFDTIKKILHPYIDTRRLFRILQAAALILSLVFWISLWLPKYRLDTLAEEYERARPFLLWLGAAGLEGFILLRIFLTTEEGRSKEAKNEPTGESFTITLLVTAIFAIVFHYFQSNISFNSGIIEPATAPVTPLQLFVLWLLVVVLYRAQQRTGITSRPIFIAVCIVLLFVLSCVMFLSTPLSCKGDMVGIHPPNFTCYPDIHDAVYNIGSLYIHYGEGIYNQWFTDKPFYMFFLAACQWIGGLQLEGYMTVQVICLSILPVIVFLFARRLAGFSSALLAALLLILRQENAIRLYSKLGGVNIRIAATEIFTAVLLVFTVWALNKWFRKPTKSVFPLASGIFLGLTILTRFNAVLIVPVILVFSVIYYWKARGLGLRKVAIFGAGLAMVLSPWFLIYPAINPNLENQYFEKIQTVFWDRSANQPAPKVQEKPPAKLIIDEADRDGRVEASLNNASARMMSKSESNLAQQMMLHFANNLFTPFFSLPINSAYLDADTLTEQSFWYRDNQPIWQKDMSAENLALWCFSIALFSLGIGQSWRRWGIGGLTPLLVLFGYLLGVSFALTSGGRYLEPVMWIVFVYCGVGLMRFTVWGFHILGFHKDVRPQNVAARETRFDHALQILRNWVEKPAVHFSGLGFLVLAAVCLPLLQFLPDRLPVESSPEVDKNAYEYLEGYVDEPVWNEFLQGERGVAVEGVLYFPQYYSQSRFSQAYGTDVFEALVLSRDYAYMSYMWNRVPLHISDGSRVILVGCVLNEGSQWGMQRRITQTLALIQLDNEKKIYVDPQAAWACP
jgi:hypothetical protein